MDRKEEIREKVVSIIKCAEFETAPITMLRKIVVHANAIIPILESEKGTPNHSDMDAAIFENNILVTENKELKSQRQPCSASCYHHQSHPCEKCGRINGYLPKVWQEKELQAKLETMSDAIMSILENAKRGKDEVCYSEIVAICEEALKGGT
jgi:hypothetical protein